ncbi:TetR/AcrR family transcriptional regulator [Lacihabitans lacunae]|jgi:AcrR family transcriptional regulator|uniref:TetR/AcrR family transcriptional regulator n=1 Tax=Lacihabitans lacunae TaxID=1028214 RepID=A0ABV7Z0T2_9BACT
MEFNDKQLSILKVAEEVISEKGFESASIREISKRANINLAMVSYYFGSKEKLMEALFIQKARQFKITTELTLKDESLGPLEKMITLFENYFEKVFCNFAFHKIMLKEISYLDSTVVYDQIKKMKTSNFDVITQVLDEGIKKGIFNPQITTDSVISLINGTVSNYALNEKYYRFRWQLKPEVSFELQTKEKIKTQILLALKAILLYHE